MQLNSRQEANRHLLITKLTRSAIIASLGFPETVDVRGRLSLADLFAKSKSRTGIYLLEFANQTFYIGQAVEVCRRFAQHCANVGEIVGFTFLPIRAAALDETERGLIRSAEAAGLPLTNRVHVSTVLGETDFDLLVAPAEQEAWLASWPRLVQHTRAEVRLPPNAPARIRTAQAFTRLSDHSMWNQVRECLQIYSAGCLPFPTLTQLSFWSVSCLPSTNKSTWPRFAAVNAGLMELMVIGWEIGGVGTWGFVNCARSVIEREHGSIQLFEGKHKRVDVDDSRQYQSAGSDQLSISADSIPALARLLGDSAVRDAAAQLALRVMRSRSNIYSKFHCPALADAMLAPLAC